MYTSAFFNDSYFVGADRLGLGNAFNTEKEIISRYTIDQCPITLEGEKYQYLVLPEKKPLKYVCSIKEREYLEGRNIMLGRLTKTEQITVIFPESWNIAWISPFAIVIINDKGRAELYINLYSTDIKVIPSFWIEESGTKKGKVSFSVMDAYGEIIYSTHEVNDDEQLEQPLKNECWKWLDERFPAWREPGAYCD